ncbi:uncharacterized protein LOC121372634 [Gigantopelta aegis]|uniref:uncharacterized protein LOC121372634 n=1 Tax=Gigantopelta aegis TaxID=1735272 RepID=UPI001B88A9F0|nr:uncharacterized protein LOC121372634 [Gigantopelta aegis]XP_041355008.1 uncharacterized protein LOC121372634 [Gigantopelta aegis]
MYTEIPRNWVPSDTACTTKLSAFGNIPENNTADSSLSCSARVHYVHGQELSTREFPSAYVERVQQGMRHTNSYVEGFHYKWNSAVGRRHPSLWMFIRKLKDEQQLLEVSAAAARRGNPPNRRRKKWRTLEDRIIRLKQSYNNGRCTLEDYWTAVTCAVRAFV